MMIQPVSLLCVSASEPFHSSGPRFFSFTSAWYVAVASSAVPVEARAGVGGGAPGHRHEQARRRRGRESVGGASSSVAMSAASLRSQACRNVSTSRLGERDLLCVGLRDDHTDDRPGHDEERHEEDQRTLHRLPCLARASCQSAAPSSGRATATHRQRSTFEGSGAKMEHVLPREPPEARCTSG